MTEEEAVEMGFYNQSFRVLIPQRRVLQTYRRETGMSFSEIFHEALHEYFKRRAIEYPAQLEKVAS